MGFAEVLTIVLVILNATGMIHVSWWLAFLPEIVAVGFYALVWLLAILFGIHVWRKG
jgi:hypothetical protein